MLVCSGHPIGVMRTEKQYENFVLHIEWMHMEAGGNSGVFVWSAGNVPKGRRLPKGVEVQMLELDWVNLHKKKDGTLPPIAYVHGEVFGAGGLKIRQRHQQGSDQEGLHLLGVRRRRDPFPQYPDHGIAAGHRSPRKYHTGR
jgi:hypothetical protein